MDPSPLAVGTIFDGTYEILALIDSGGMGSVYRARHVHLQHECALKVLSADREQNPSSSSFQRFRREAQVLSSLSHPNIVSCSSFGINEGRLYLVMDLIEGTSLRATVSRGGPLPEQNFRHVFQQVLDAVSHAHAQGVVHRDLKPENIMLTGTGSDTVRIIDFGIAKLQAAEGASLALTKTGEILGSPSFMSPEQCSGGVIDERTDIYAIGCVMYFALTGKIAFASDNLFEVVQNHLSEPFPALPAAVPKAIRIVVQTATEKTPSKRYQSAAEMKDALNKIVGNSMIDVIGLNAGFGKSGTSKKRVILMALSAALLLGGAASFRLNEKNNSSTDQLISRLQDDYAEMLTLREQRSRAGQAATHEEVVSILAVVRSLVSDQLLSAQRSLQSGDIESASTYLNSARRNIQVYRNALSSTPDVGYQNADILFAVGKQIDEQKKRECAFDAAEIYEKEFERYPQADHVHRLDNFEKFIAELGGSEPLDRGEILVRGATFAYQNNADARSKRLAMEAAKCVVAGKPDSRYQNTMKSFVIRGLILARGLIGIAAYKPALTALEPVREVAQTGPEPMALASSVLYWIGLARVLSEPEVAEAEQALRQSAALAIKDGYSAAPIYAFLAQRLRLKGKLKEAKEAAELAIAQEANTSAPPYLDADLISPQLELGIIHLEMSEPDRALAAFDKFVKANKTIKLQETWMTPSNLSASHLLTYTLAHANGGKLSATDAHLADVAKDYLVQELDRFKNPRTPSQRSAIIMDCFLLAQFYWRQGQPDLCQTWMTRAIQALPESDLRLDRQAQLFAMQAELDYLAKRWKNCINHCTVSIRVYALEPIRTSDRQIALARLHVMMGASYRRLDNKAKSESALREAIRFAEFSQLEEARLHKRDATTELNALLVETGRAGEAR